jgi:hypothetical protein
MSSDFHSPVNNCRFLQWKTRATLRQRAPNSSHFAMSLTVC